MANRNFPNSRIYTFHVMPVQVTGSITIGATGAVSAFGGSGVAGVTRLKAGVYRIQLQDNYNGCFNLVAGARSPTTGSAVNSGSFSVGTLYTITTLGTTNYNLIGIPAGITPAIGMAFVATGVGTGNGTATAIGSSGINAIEQVSNISGYLNKQPATPLSGGYVIIQCLGPTSSSVTTLIPTDPASGSQITFKLLLNNSSVQ